MSVRRFVRLRLWASMLWNVEAQMRRIAGSLDASS
jgi:hypothetical protein